ncbi:MAG: outer membrane protein assembly factor BamB [Chthoniobacter sp.]|jgi:outer membrane protein assembly factor BamB|nr:outer membrane protein assembly factor BamB [Chthoniobacter sp.]
MKLLTPPTFLLAALACALTARAENWPHWRGPAFNGSSPETGLPASFSASEGVKWTAPLPGFSGATPVIWGDSIFVSSPDANKNLLLLCLDRKTGKVRWQKQLAEGDQTKGRTSPNMASPSPVTDGQAVYALYGTGDLAALDFSGQILWQRHLGADFGRFANMWLYGSSPTLFQGRLYIQVLQRDPVPNDYTHAIDGKPNRDSFLLAIDPKTGKDLWRHVRPTDAHMESMESYATPIPFEQDGKAQVLILGGDCLTAHDAATGAELWRCGGFNDKKGEWMRIVSSPVAGPGLVFATGPKRQPLLAIKAGGKGDVTATHVAWKFSDFPPDVCTPALYRDQLYVLDGDKQMLTCLDPATGAKKWEGNLGTRENFKSSPTAADGKIYAISERGTVVICEAGAEFKIIATIPLGSSSPTRSAIAVADGQLFIRTGEQLYCVGK